MRTPPERLPSSSTGRRRPRKRRLVQWCHNSSLHSGLTETARRRFTVATDRTITPRGRTVAERGPVAAHRRYGRPRLLGGYPPLTRRSASGSTSRSKRSRFRPITLPGSSPSNGPPSMVQRSTRWPDTTRLGASEPVTSTTFDWMIVVAGLTHGTYAAGVLESPTSDEQSRRRRCCRTQNCSSVGGEGVEPPASSV